MLDQLGSLVEELKRRVGNLDVGGLSGDEAMKLCARFAELERLAAAGRLMTAERVATPKCGAAAACGRPPTGSLSEAQAHAIVDAVAVRPGVEERLVEFARSNSLRRLREECRRAKNADVSAADEYKKVHASREYRTWIGRDGAVCGSFRLTAEAGAALNAAIEERKAMTAARRDGRREPFPAYAADALVELVTEHKGVGAPVAGRQTKPKQMMIVHVAYEAIIRGALADGETCEIRGIGPIPLEVAQSLALDSILRVLVTKGGQPLAVTPGSGRSRSPCGG